MIKQLLYKLFCLLPVAKNKIIFWGYYGAQYGCSPKYISRYISTNEHGWDQVWATLDPESIVDPKVRKVRFASLRFLYELATAHFLVTNYRLGLDMSKRRRQVYIQTWHSSLRLKKIEKDAEKYLPETYIEQAKRDSPQIDYLLSGCRESTRIFRQAFWYDGSILEIGTPRIDPIIHPSEEVMVGVKKTLGLDEGDKVLLYGPTFRRGDNYDCYIKDFTTILAALTKKFTGKWKVVARLHPHLMDKAQDVFHDKNIIHASRYPDIQELLMITDFLITDYSSLMFDFLFSKRPVMLYLPDLQEYRTRERELYYEVEELPFLKVYSLDEIAPAISAFDQEDYMAGIERFVDGIGSFERGDASARLVEMLKQLD